MFVLWVGETVPNRPHGRPKQPLTSRSCAAWASPLRKRSSGSSAPARRRRRDLDVMTSRGPLWVWTFSLGKAEKAFFFKGKTRGNPKDRAEKQSALRCLDMRASTFGMKNHLIWVFVFLGMEWIGGGFAMFLKFHPDPWGNDSISRAFFSSNGWKPPPRWYRLQVLLPME